MAKRRYRVMCAYDTETTTLGDDHNAVAYPVLWIVNDLTKIDLSEYEYGRDDDIRLYRTEFEMHDYIRRLIDYGRKTGEIPIICAYNLMFDLTPLMHWMAENYRMDVSAQTGTSVYTIDLYSKEDTEKRVPLLRWWDTFYLEQGGLRAMGETCGLPKAVGDWDYSLIRTPQTPLTEREKHYAGRDTQVIPAYLRYLLDANEWMKPEMLGVRVVTKTSVVRQMGVHEIGVIKQHYQDETGADHTLSLQKQFNDLCVREQAKDYETYALRKACFRGGLTFTAADYASREVHNVASLDVTSMHHTYINGRYVPVRFHKAPADRLTDIARKVSATDISDVLTNYHQPFGHAFHAQISYENLRLKAGSPFEKYGIALLSQSKFDDHGARMAENITDTAAVMAADALKKYGWKDEAEQPVFAYGKLMSARRAVVFVNEIEAWNIAQVYDYDRMTVIRGEVANSFILPPAYISLQSNVLFERKQVIKHILRDYQTGVPYTEDIPPTVPQGIADGLRKGDISREFLQAYYQSTVKGSFNAIYGTQAQDIFKPGFVVTSEGDIRVDTSTVPNRENYKALYRKELYGDRRIPHCKVLYTYGMRIVAGSRMHLVIAIMSLWKALGTKAIPTGGDTDSLKVACASDVTDEMLSTAEQPIAQASDRAIDRSQTIIRTIAPRMASTLRPIGHFDIEDAGIAGVHRYRSHMEAWNKARVSLDMAGRVHVTIAGLSRPEGTVTIEDALTALHRAGYPFADVARLIGYDVTVYPALSHSLEKARPKPGERFIEVVTDYRGGVAPVAAPRSIALYPAARVLGDPTKGANANNIKYLHRIGHDWRQPSTIIDYDGKEVTVWQGERKTMTAPKAGFTTGSELSPMTRL